MTRITRKSGLLALGLALIVLTGCDAAEESAQKLFDETVEKTTEAARKVVGEAVGAAVEKFNEQLDGAQQRVKATFGEPEEEGTETEQAAGENRDAENRG